MDYLINGSSGWGCALVVYSLEVDPKGPALVRLHVIKKNYPPRSESFCIELMFEVPVLLSGKTKIKNIRPVVVYLINEPPAISPK